MSDFQEIDEIVVLPPMGLTPGYTAAASQTVQDTSPGAPARTMPSDSTASAPTAGGTGAKKGALGFIGALAASIAKWWAVVLSVILKFKGILVAAKLLTAGKLLLTGGTMFLSMFLWSYRFGWPMAVGVVMSIFLHECGHALAAKKLGHKLGIMLFVPFMGAVVTSRGGRTVAEGAFVGIMGPIAGTLTALACLGIYTVTHSGLWLALATVGFFINLINLTPARPLDGGWIVPLFSPKLLLPGIVLAVIVFHSNPFVWLLAIMSIPGTLFAWRHGHDSPYYKATSRDRWVYGLTYVGLIAFLASALVGTSTYMKGHDQVRSRIRMRSADIRS